MIIWRGAIARTGGTVLQQVVEQMLRRAGLPFQRLTQDHLQRLPLTVTRDARGVIREMALRPDSAAHWEQTIGIGGHDAWISPAFALPQVRVFYVRRDPFSRIRSWRRLTGAPFAEVEHAFRQGLRMGKLFEALPDQTCLKLDYQSHVLDLAAGSAALAAFLGLWLPDADRLAVVADLDRRAVTDRLSQEETRWRHRLGQWNDPGPGRQPFAIRFADGAECQVYLPAAGLRGGGEAPVIFTASDGARLTLHANRDRRTWRPSFGAFQSGHVSAAAPTEAVDAWRDLFSPAEQARLEAIAALEGWGG